MGRKRLLPNRADLILKAAADLFAERTYEKTTLDGIAERAGIGKGSIYLEFESKEEILFALICRSKQAELHEMRRLVANPGESPLKTLKQMLVKNIGMVYDAVSRNRRSPEEMMQSRERLKERLKPFFDERIECIEALLLQAVKAGEIRPLRKPRRTAQLMMMALRTALPPYETNPQKLKLQNDAAEILELIFEGLRHHES
ncbi:MAG TPA: helix-turn-helix domain-containing protein [Oculatellaceae cyanobacterium]